MKVIINYTVYLGDSKDEDRDISYYQKYIAQRHGEIADELKYQTIKSVYGYHRNAERFHLHYHTVNVIPEGVKEYKILNDKIKRLKCYKIQSLPYKDFIVPEVKISFNYESAMDYNEEKSLSYPLKEYGDDKEMFREVKSLECISVTDKELQHYRSQSNKIYKQACKEYEKKEKKQTNKEDLYTHLDNVIITTDIPNYYGEVDSVVRYTVKHMLMYYKKEQKPFSVHQLKNGAVNYLYFKDIITEEQICDLLNI
jgi:hypothetical protein